MATCSRREVFEFVRSCLIGTADRVAASNKTKTPRIKERCFISAIQRSVTVQKSMDGAHLGGRTRPTYRKTDIRGFLAKFLALGT
jgi:hypothetical protein